MEFADWAENDELDDLAQALFWFECVKPEGNHETQLFNQAQGNIARLIMYRVQSLGVECNRPTVALAWARKYLQWKDWRPGQEGNRPKWLGQS